MPLDASCNPLVTRTPPDHSEACAHAKLGLALFRASPAAFTEYDDFMFASEEPPAFEQAQAKAETLAGKAELLKASRDPWVAEQLAMNIEIYRANSQIDGNTSLPQLVIGQVIVRGTMVGEQLSKILESHTTVGRIPEPARANADGRADRRPAAARCSRAGV
jgi:hypothetical protein